MVQSMLNTDAVILNANNYRPLRECISGRNGRGRGRSFFCDPVVALHSRCNSFLQTDFTSRYRLRRMRGLHCRGSAPTLAWPVIVRSVAPRGANHGTARNVPWLLNPRTYPRSRFHSLFAVVRCVGVLTSIDYGITRGTRHLMAYYYQAARRDRG